MGLDLPPASICLSPLVNAAGHKVDGGVPSPAVPDNKAFLPISAPSPLNRRLRDSPSLWSNKRIAAAEKWKGPLLSRPHLRSH